MFMMEHNKSWSKRIWRRSGNELPKENMHYTCIACITIDSVMRMDKKKPSAGLFSGMQI